MDVDEANGTRMKRIKQIEHGFRTCYDSPVRDLISVVIMMISLFRRAVRYAIFYYIEQLKKLVLFVNVAAGLLFFQVDEWLVEHFLLGIPAVDG